ncbi:MAG: alpha/beta hydrolase [Gammaproteobacteria bacterium]|nr:alpha/beta hydrolase [Gammaproteobacteria bacterium]
MSTSAADISASLPHSSGASPLDASGSRGFPPPLSISPQAQAVLSGPGFGTVPPPLPEPHDLQGWRRHIAEHNATLAALLLNDVPEEACSATWDKISGVPIVRARPATCLFGEGKVLLEIHGGALIYMGGELVRSAAKLLVMRTGSELISIDYRMPPDHPFPAALDDCLAVYIELLREIGAENLIVYGTSAGGNLAAALLLRARDEGHAMPAALILISPEIDLTESGDSFRTLLGIDRMGLLTAANQLYANGQPLDHPYLSPLFGDVSGFPSTFLQSGTRDLFLSNTVRMHRALRTAGIVADLHIWEAMPHGGFFGAPEDEEVFSEVRQFMGRHWQSAVLGARR